MNNLSINNWVVSEFGPPIGKGVYAVCSLNVTTKEKELLYIGSSKNIQKRVLNPSHPYRILFNMAQYPVVIFTKSKLCDNYIELEKLLIKRLQPKHNIIHKNQPLCDGPKI